MTNEEINIAIAEAVGEVCPHCGSPSLDKKECGSISGMWHAVTTKDYCHDLDAMHGAIMALDYDSLMRWHVENRDVAYRNRTSPELTTAPQRAEAYLRVKGKWRD